MTRETNDKSFTASGAPGAGSLIGSLIPTNFYFARVRTFAALETITVVGEMWYSGPVTASAIGMRLWPIMNPFWGA
jgi:hypothetical protein